MSLLVHRGLVSELKETPPWVADCRGVLLEARESELRLAEEP